MKLLRVVLLVLLACMAAPARSQRLVFAHYMLTNQDYHGDDGTAAAQELKIAAYECEIREAQSVGIDGFALNAGGWLRETYYIRYAAQMFEAAVRLHSGFKLMFSADMCCGNSAADVEDMMRRFAGNSRYAEVYFRYKGAFVLTTFSGEKLGVALWQRVRSDLEHGTNPSTTMQPSALAAASAVPDSRPLPVFLVPAFFWGGELPNATAISAGLDTWRTVLDGAFYWGIAGVPGAGDGVDQLPSGAVYAGTLRDAHKLYMAPVTPGFWGSNASRYYDYSGYEGMRALWKQAAEQTRPAWVEIITWNDFIEGTYVSPIDDPNRYVHANFLTASGIPLGTRDYFHTHAGFFSLLPWFIQWYKMGVQPSIHTDMVAVAYRTVMRINPTGSPPVGRIYGDAEARLYITANLKAPATLLMTVGGRTSSIPLAAGSHDVRAALLPGAAPSFQLMRGDVIVCKGVGADPITPTAMYNNLLLSTATCHSQ